MPKLDRSTSSQDQYPVGANASQTQPYVPIERTIGIGQLPPIHLPSEQSLFVIQEGGLTGQITLREVAAYFGNTPVTSVNGQTGDVELKLSDLVGVTIIDPLNNNFLSYNAGKWINKSLTSSAVVSFNGFQGVITNAGLNILNDVTVTNPANGQTLIYSSLKNKWENQSLTDLYPDLTDTNGLVTITGLAGLQINNMLNTYGTVTFHDNRPTITNVLPTTNQYAVSTMGDLQNLDLNHLHDVSMSNPVPNGNVVSWNEVANKWVNVEYDPTGRISSMLWTPTSVTTGEFSSVCLDTGFLSLILASQSDAGLYWTKDNKSVYQSNITSGNFYKVIVFKDTIYAAGDVGVLKSSDGKIWTATSITEPATNLLTDGNILLILFHASIGFKQTSDGVTFTAPVTSGVYKVGDVEPNEDPTKNIWLLGGATTVQNSLGGFGVVSYSLDGGATWAAQSTAEEITAITYARGNSFLVSSTDGLFAAIASSSAGSSVVTWEKLVDGNYTDVVFNSGLILALRLDDIPLWSTDAFNWNPTTGALPSLPLHTAAFGNGYWSAGGVNTGIWWSIDGREWALSNQVTGTLNKVIYGGTAWLALMGNDGGILWSNNTTGKVLSVNGQTGIVEIGLNNLRGTKIIAPIDGDFLIYKNGLWENRNIVDVSNISVHNLTVTETATIDNLVVNTSTFSGLATFNSGLTSTTGSFSGVLNTVKIENSGDISVGGITTLSGLLNANSGANVSDLTVTGQSTLSGLTANAPIFTGTITGKTAPLGLLTQNSTGNGFVLYNTTGSDVAKGTLRYIAGSFSADLVFNNTTISYNESELATLANLNPYAKTVDVNTALGLKANANNATLTGVPTAPTAPTSTNTTQLATTAFVQSAISSIGAYPNLTSSGTGVDTLLAYVGTQGMAITKGPLLLDSETPSTFLYRPTITTLSVNNTSANSIATISDITSGTLLNADFKSINSRGSVGGVTLNITSGASISGTTTLGTLSCVSGGFSTLAVSGTSTLTGLLTANGGVSTTNVAVSGTATFTTGPTAPTAPTGTNTTQLATTAFVQTAFATKANTIQGPLSTPIPGGGSFNNIMVFSSPAPGGRWYTVTGQAALSSSSMTIGATVINFNKKMDFFQYGTCSPAVLAAYSCSGIIYVDASGVVVCYWTIENKNPFNFNISFFLPN